MDSLSTARPPLAAASDGADDPLADALRGVVARDPAALARLFDLSVGAVNAVVMRILGQPEDAEEVVSDVYWRVWERASDWDEARGPVLAWLRMLAWSRALDAYRSRHRERLRRGVHPIDPEETYASAWNGDTPTDPMALRLDAQAAVSALDVLTPGQRQVLSLVFGEGLSHAEVAGRTGLPLGTVKSHARRGMDALRMALGVAGGAA